MRRILSLGILLWLGINSLFAQGKTQIITESNPIPHSLSTKVVGKVLGENQSPLGKVTICLVELPDRNSMTLSRTKSDGSFEFDHIEPGHYMIIANWVGKVKKNTESFLVEPFQEKILDTIMLDEKSKNKQDSLRGLSSKL